MARYHDDYYDGVVIKIPMGVIVTNDMQDKLNELKEYFEACKFSSQHPDHQMNIRELECYPEKVQEQKKDREEAEERNRVYQQRQEQRNQKLVSHEILPLERVTKKDEIDRDYITISGTHHDVFTTRGNFKTSAKKVFDEFVSTSSDEDIIEMLTENGFHSLLHNVYKMPPELVALSSLNLYVNNYLNLCISLEWPVINVYSKSPRAKRLSYRRTDVYYDKDSQEYYVSNLVEGGEQVDGNYRRYLSDYELDGREFTKK